MSDYERGKSHLDNLISEHANSDRLRNEAETRFKILDELILHVLGWPKSQTNLECHRSGSFTDYELAVPSQVVVEAKREGAHFDIPPGFGETPKIQQLRDLSSELDAVITQAMQYGQQRGIAIAVVSNGHQLAAFLASRQDGVAPDDGRALLFSSLAEMGKRFRELWESLSPAGVQADYLRGRLRARALVPPPGKLSRSLVGYPGFKNRNPLAADLQILGGVFIEDVAKDPGLEESFLRATYCKSGALSQYALVSREILGARYSQVFDASSEVSSAPATTTKGVNPALTQDMFAAALRRRPILLVGDVGAGKTMFIRNLTTVEARSELRDAMVMYLDFGSKPALATELKRSVAKELKNQLLEKYQIDIEERSFLRGAYHSELSRFVKGIYGSLKDTAPAEYAQREREMLANHLGDEDEHLRKSLEHVSKGHKKQVVIFLDNVDQRPIGFQEEVFLIAQSIAEHWPATVFVSLRPETFAQSKVSGALAAYQPRVFTIDPPRVDRVVTSRIEFALSTLKNTGSLPSTSSFSFQSSSLTDYLTVIQRSLQSGGPIVEFLDNMSAGNIRKALDFLQTFIGSGHVDSRKILDIESNGGAYTLPLHEFLRAVMFGDKAYYDPKTSPIPNVLDISTADGREHFLVPLFVSCAEQLGVTGVMGGYVERTKLLNHLQPLGFQLPQLESGLKRCLDANLLATPGGGPDDRLRVTTRGAYVVKRLLQSFPYVDAVLVDTPVLEPTTRSRLRDVTTIDERAARCAEFAAYLDRQWCFGADEINLPFSWPAVGAALKHDIDKVLLSAQRRRK
jgi:hypothetical protein